MQSLFVNSADMFMESLIKPECLSAVWATFFTCPVDLLAASTIFLTILPSVLLQDKVVFAAGNT